MDIITGEGRYKAEWRGKEIEVDIKRATHLPARGLWDTGVRVDFLNDGDTFTCYGSGAPFADGPRIISRIPDEPEIGENVPAVADFEPEWKAGDECVPFYDDGDEVDGYAPYKFLCVATNGRFVTEDCEGDVNSWEAIRRPVNRREWTGRNQHLPHGRQELIIEVPEGVSKLEADTSLALCLTALNNAEAAS